MVAHEGVDLQALIVRHQHFLALVVERQNALVDIDHRVDKRPLEIEARRVDEVAHRLAETQDERLLGRIDDKRRHRDKNDRDDRNRCEGDAVKGPAHLAPAPVFDCNGSSAIYGTRGLEEVETTIVLSLGPRPRSIVSRFIRSRVTAGAFLYCW